MPMEGENGFSNGMINGVSNGCSEHKSHKDHKHRDKDHHKSSHKDKDRSKDKHSSSHKSSHKDRHKDKDRDRHRDKDRHRSKDREEKRHSKEDGERHKSKEKDRHRKSSDHKSRHHSSHKSSHKEKHRDKSREEPSSKPKIKEEQASFGSVDDFKTSNGPVVKDEPPKMDIDSEEDSKLLIKEEPAEPINAAPDEDDIPLAMRKRVKVESEDDDDVPLIARKKKKVERKIKVIEDTDFKLVKKVKKESVKRKAKDEPAISPVKKKKKTEEEEHVWKWWEEEKKNDGVKWNFLEHHGPVFAEAYERLPPNIKFYYDGEQVLLSQDAEEIGGFYARMLDHDYTTKEVFNKNFFHDWRKSMTSEERSLITDLKKCDFSKIHRYFLEQAELRKNRTKEEKKALKEKNEALTKIYGWCNIDHHKQKIGNFKIEPPGLFRGRGEHPKQGKLKKRIVPEDVIINCSKNSAIPKPPEGHKWKEVRHDKHVTWLACWVENVQQQTKYVMLNAASKLKGEKDWQKYETARRLHKLVDKIRDNYMAEFKSKEMRVRQRAVALYFIDKLALRAGNEKDEDQADTVGCCSLRVEHLRLLEQKDGKEFVVVFDFLGKDSIRYYNEVPVEKRVFKNLQLFMENKHEGDDLFDRLNTQIMNKYLNDLMEGLTAKVFRTYNASRTLQEQLDKLTDADDNVPAKILSYNRANREVAILCNHQRAVPKTFEKSMANLQSKIEEKRDQLADERRHLKDLKRNAKGSVKESSMYEKKKKTVERVEEQLHKLEISATDKEENKQIALGTSKLNYLDPRISVAWCKKYNVPIEKVYNKTQRLKFQWAIDMATAHYNFLGEPMTRQDSEDE